MNNPEDYCPSFEEMIAWLESHKAATGYSWSQLGALSGISAGTMSGMVTPNYAGSKPNAAKRLYQFQQKVESQAARKHLMLREEPFIETPTARRVLFLLQIAHMGRMTVAAMGPGTSKTKTAEHYQASVGNSAIIVTMRKSTGSLAGMMREVVKALGVPVKSGWNQQLSAIVVEHLRGRNILLIIDEANHLSLEALEELRGWHDETDVGIALLGNEELMMRIRGHRDRHAYSRLASRIANYHIQDLPMKTDVETYLDAMDIIESDLRKPLIDIGLSTGSGGLREVRMVLEAANMLAIGDDTVLANSHVREAIQSRATSQMRRAA